MSTAEQRWDAIVIGSGLGGLSAAAHLTTNGLRTLVLEQYDQIGGSTHVFRRKREWEFDVGVHYVGDVHGDGAVGTVLSGLGLDDRIEFAQLDPDSFDTLVFPDQTFRVPADWDLYLERLIEAFPGEERGLRLCVRIMRRLGEEVFRASFPDSRKGYPKLLPKIPTVATIGMLPMDWIFAACRLSPRARAVLSAQHLDYAVPSGRAPAVLVGGILHHYIRQGGHYPKGGGQVFAAHLLDVIQTHGGQARTHALVERILLDGGRVRGVRLADGTELSAPVVVSNADLKRTYLNLVGREHLSPKTVKKVSGYRMSPPMFTVYLGLDIDLRERMGNTQLWSIPDGFDANRVYRQVREGTIPDDLAVFISSATVKDPGNRNQAPPGHSTLELMTIAPADHAFYGLDRGPAEGGRYRRNPDYQAVKERLIELLIGRAEDVLGPLREHIVWREASSPITQERYTLASGGTSYGIEMSWDQFGPFRPGARTEIEGLFLAGASLVWGHGVVGSLNSGRGAASAVLGRDLRAEAKAGRVFTDRSRLTAGGEGWDPWQACRMVGRTRKHSGAESGSGEIA